MPRSILFAILLLPFISAARETPAHSKPASFAARQSLLFVENKGQVRDQDGKARNDIDFKLSAGQGLNVFIGKGQLHYQWSKTNSIPKVRNKSKNSKPSLPDDGLTTYESSLTTSSYRMDVELLGANTNAEVISEAPQSYYENYFLSGLGKGVTRIHTYRKVTYKNVYPNIDWVLYISDGSNNPLLNTSLSLGEGRGEALEYDFVVHPGGNVKEIQLKYSGADDIHLNADGSLAAITPFGAISEKAPSTYEKESGLKVNSSFALNDGILTFATGQYNGTVVIDPTLAWCTYYGGTGDDRGMGVVCDAAGNVFMKGSTNSSNNIATLGAYISTYATNASTFLTKFDGTGSRQWATYYLGFTLNSNELCCDQNGHVFITGYVDTTVHNLATPNAYQASGAGKDDAYVAGFDGSGNLLWATYFGGTQHDLGEGIACDASGNVFLTGETFSSTGIASPGAYQTSLPGTVDQFLAKFNSGGVLQWSTYFGGNCNTYHYPFMGIVCDGGGNVFITGPSCTTANIASPGSYQTTQGGGQDAFLAKFNGSGGFQWATYFGGGSDDVGRGLAYDNIGAIYLTGYTTSSNNIATSNAYQTTLIGTGEAFLAKFDVGGTLDWATYFGGFFSSSDAYALACNSAGDVYMGGLTENASNMLTANAYQNSVNGIDNGFLARFNSSGNLIYGTCYGGQGGDYITGLACDVFGDIFMCGIAGSGSGISTPGAYQLNIGGSNDAFLGKWMPDSLFLISTPTSNVYCAGDTFHLNFQALLAYQSGNVFTIQLSDSSGSFSNPINIGTDTATASGSIFCRIPANTLTGNHYRFRVVSATPSGITNPDSVNITIGSKPFFSVNANTPICKGSTLQFNTVNSFSPVSYRWAGPNNFSSSSSGPVISNITLADSGNYYVTDTLSGCTTTDTIHVIVLPTPAIPAAGSNGPICQGDSLKLNASDSTTAVSYHWTGPGVFLSLVQNPIKTNTTLSDSGCYYVSATLNGCSSYDSVFVAVKPIPATPLSSSNSPVCAGDTLKLFATDTTNGVSYNWHGPGLYSSGLQNPTRINSITAYSGTYTVAATLNGCLSSASTTLVSIVPIAGAPTVSIVASPDTICVGSNVTFSSSVANSVNPSYEWFRNGAVIAGANTASFSTASVSNGDHITCKVTSNAICQPIDTARSNEVIIHAILVLPPVISVTSYPPNYVSGDTVTFTGHLPLNTIGLSYQWRKNGVNIAGANFSVYTSSNVSLGDTICLVVHSSVPCTTPDSSVSCVGLSTGVENLSTSGKVKVYPNPINKELTIEGIDKGALIKIFDIVGQLVFSGTAGADKVIVNTAEFAKGTYVLELVNEKGERCIQKIIKY